MHPSLLLAPLILAAALAGCAASEPPGAPSDAETAATDAAPNAAPGAASAPPSTADPATPASAPRTERAKGSFTLALAGPPVNGLHDATGQYFVGGGGEPFLFQVNEGEQAVVVDFYWNEDSVGAMGMRIVDPDGGAETAAPADGDAGPNHVQLRYKNATAGEWRAEIFSPGPRALISYQWVVTAFRGPLPGDFEAGAPE